MKRIKTLLESKYTLIIVIIFTIISMFRNIPSSIDNIYIIKHLKISEDKIVITTKHTLITYYVKDDILDLKIGDEIKVDGDISTPNDNTNFNLFNYRLYLKSKKIYQTIKATDIKVISHTNNPLYKIKNMIIDKINKYDKKEYLYTFILGDNAYLDSDIKSSFSNNGISHLFSVSGMHVTLLTIVIIYLLNKIRKSNINYIVLIMFLLFYAFLTNYTPSIMRSSLMFILLYLNKLFKLNIKAIYIFIYLVCAFLIYNPDYIYNVGFLFSFIITFHLILFGSIASRYKNYFSKLFITSTISFLASMPILINKFNSINLLSPILNLLFVPLISFIIFPLSIVSFFIPTISSVLNIFINILEYLTIFFSRFSINIILASMPMYIVFLYYVIIIYVLYKMRKGKYKYLLIIFVILLIHTNTFNLNNEIHYLDVSQGDSILLRYKYNKSILIDTGGLVNSNYSIAMNITIPYLKSLGIKKLEAIIITHGDNDHMGEAINLIENFKVEKVIFNCGEYNDLEKDLIKVLDKKKIKYYSCIDKLDELYFLNTRLYDNENDNSNVIYTEINGYKFMFMGDAGIIKEKDILKKYDISNIDVLKVGHHGSKTSSSIEFIDKINPLYSVISVGKNNRYGHPNKEVLNNLDNSKIYRTDQDGSIMFKIKNNKLKIETCSP